MSCRWNVRQQTQLTMPRPSRTAGETDSTNTVRCACRSLAFPKTRMARPTLTVMANDGYSICAAHAGSITTGVYLNSGVLNLALLKGRKGGRIWPKARLRDGIDAIIAHQRQENRHGIHAAAVKAAPKTELPISNEARRRSLFAACETARFSD